MSYPSKIPVDTRSQNIRAALGIDATDADGLLNLALTHPSYTNEATLLSPSERQQRINTFHRLAHLGDAIFQAILTDQAYQDQPNATKANLHASREKFSQGTAQAEFAQELNLKQFIRYGNGAQQTLNERERSVSEPFEALIGAVFLCYNRDFHRTARWLSAQWKMKQ
jgi:ribonuclease III